MARNKKYRPDIVIELWNELPKIGSGYRCFKVLKRGTKWIYLVATADQTLAKMSIHEWKYIPQHVLDRKGRRTGEIVFG